jgi:hypothetical protein
MAEDAITDEVAELNPWIGVKVRDDDRRATKQARRLRVWSFEEMHEFASYAGRYEPMIRTFFRLRRTPWGMSRFAPRRPPRR